MVERELMGMAALLLVGAVVEVVTLAPLAVALVVSWSAELLATLLA